MAAGKHAAGAGLRLETPLLSDPALMAATVAMVTLAAIVQAGLGMGFGLTAAPLLAVLDPALVPGPMLILSLVTSAWVAARDPGQIRWPEVWLACAGRLAGAGAVTAVLLSVADRSTVSVIFAVLIGSAVALSALGLRLRCTRPRLVWLGALSGVVGTVTSVGGPVMALLYQDRPPREARATLSAFFVIGCAMSLGMLAATGLAGLRDLWLAALMTPPMVAGMLLGKRFQGRFDRRYRPAILAVSGFAAMVILVRELAVA